MRPHISVKALPCFNDNYCWLITNKAHNTTILVDPAEPSSVLPHIPKDLELCGSLTTHHHNDHAGGNVEIAGAFPGLSIIGGSQEGGKIPCASRLVDHGEVFELGGITITALHTPCHTRGHICYYIPAEEDSSPILFTGDTLFSGGCGRFFEGDSATMLSSFDRIMALPPSTQIFCGHEYVE